MSSPNILRRAALLIVLSHFLVNVFHGLAHSSLYIHMSAWQNIYIFIVIVASPIVSLLIIKRLPRAGFALLFVSMMGALVFGVYYHFIAAGPDNVASLPEHAWSMPFHLTAILLALIEAAGALIGFMGLRSR